MELSRLDNGQDGLKWEQRGDYHEYFPVVIVGSGPTGLTLANLLGLYGIPLLLVEKNGSTVREPRAVSIDDEALRIMQAAGLVQEIMRDVVPGYGSHYYSPRGGCFVKVEPTGAPYGYPRRNAFQQPMLEEQLRLGLQRFRFVRSLYGWQLQGFITKGMRVWVKLVGPEAASREVMCDYLVGADGANSTVRQQLGICLEGTSFEERWLIIDLVNFRNTFPHTKVFCDYRRPCVSLPGPHSTRRYEFKVHPHERDEDMLEPSSINRLLVSHEADAAATIVRKTIYKFHARVAPEWHRGRVLLAGDAAHLTPPFAGQGMNSGIRDACNLAWRLAMLVRDQAGSGLLDSYDIERRHHVWQMIRLAQRMGRIMAPANAWSALLTQFGFCVLSAVPVVRDYLKQMNYKPKPRFHQGFIIADELSPRDTWVGQLFPQPVVLRADHKSILLDEVLGNRFCLIGRLKQPDEMFSGFNHPVWEKLRIGRVAVLLEHCSPPSDGAITWVREEGDGLRKVFAVYPNHLLLLRPDHYVLTSIPLGQAHRSAEKVEALLNSTFKSGEQMLTD